MDVFERARAAPLLGVMFATPVQTPTDVPKHASLIELTKRRI
jgi:hypothetical protein